MPTNLINCSSYSCVVPRRVFPRSKDFSCCPGIWPFTGPSWHTETGRKSSLQFCLSALSLTPASVRDSLSHSFCFLYATRMWPVKAVKAVTSHFLSSLLFRTASQMQNAHIVNRLLADWNAVTYVQYLIISTLYIHWTFFSSEHF